MVDVEPVLSWYPGGSLTTTKQCILLHLHRLNDTHHFLSYVMLLLIKIYNSDTVLLRLRVSSECSFSLIAM